MIYVGTSGYLYRAWIGSFYPHGIRDRAMLDFYCRRFSALELNFTFYGIPKPRIMAGICDRVPPELKVFVKCNSTITHLLDMTKVDEFRRCLEPVSDSGRLAGVLAQFPQSFANTEENRRYLCSLSRSFSDCSPVIEFRHSSWITQPVLGFLRENGLGYCCVDEPPLEKLPPPIAASTNHLGYVRFHSRDAGKWYAKGQKDRYDYLYSTQELTEWVPGVCKMNEEGKDVYIFFNNCHAGNAALNATELKNLLSQVTGEIC